MKQLPKAREIKFRAWNKNEKRMVYGRSVNFRDQSWAVDEKPNCEIEYCPGGYTTDGEGELMQYTGLKDEKGVPVYEGDIISHPTFKPKQRNVVKWDNKRGGFNAWSETENDWCSKDWLNVGNNREIIGNIYENPELLEEKI